jgi:hypothetical protein
VAGQRVGRKRHGIITNIGLHPFILGGKAKLVEWLAEALVGIAVAESKGSRITEQVYVKAPGEKPIKGVSSLGDAPCRIGYCIEVNGAAGLKAFLEADLFEILSPQARADEA